MHRASASWCLIVGRCRSELSKAEPTRELESYRQYAKRREGKRCSGSINPGSSANPWAPFLKLQDLSSDQLDFAIDSEAIKLEFVDSSREPRLCAPVQIQLSKLGFNDSELFDNQFGSFVDQPLSRMKKKQALVVRLAALKEETFVGCPIHICALIYESPQSEPASRLATHVEVWN